MNKESETFERHTRKCSICRHPDRDAIEDEFLHWHRVIWIAQEFHIPTTAPSTVTPGPLA